MAVENHPFIHGRKRFLYGKMLVHHSFVSFPERSRPRLSCLASWRRSCGSWGWGTYIHMITYVDAHLYMNETEFSMENLDWQLTVANLQFPRGIQAVFAMFFHAAAPRRFPGGREPIPSQSIVKEILWQLGVGDCWKSISHENNTFTQFYTHVISCVCKWDKT